MQISYPKIKLNHMRLIETVDSKKKSFQQSKLWKIEINYIRHIVTSLRLKTSHLHII